ncbi:hypothetical protein CANMA_005291 [Candida margitis]|uniref:uncharacterized protein n=1 Tax=Candida margitis TaxID=1775924 RepID=UPI002226E2EB|nr:uncharacterized protein CANMA_005291 [Candida margitis]KAI5950631.1 hypothetical protein CANMA_005291 [Candida margitis]
MSSTKVQQVSRKRLGSPIYEAANSPTSKRSRKIIVISKEEEDPVSTEKEQLETSKPESERPTEETRTISQITFNQRHQSILSIVHFKEPLQLQSEYPIPEVSPHEVLVQNKAIGLNPIDWKGKKYGFGIYHFPWINGRESSGDIVKVGSKVAHSEINNLSIGDKVIVSSTSYRDNRTSTFQQFTAIDSRLVWKLPPQYSYEDGATIGVGLVTAGILLYNSFGFELTSTPKQRTGTLLVWGGSTIVGIYSAQMAKLHGLTVIAIAGNKHASYLTSLGVDHVIDRFGTDEEILAKIDELAPHGVDFGIDCVSKETAIKVLNILDTNSDKLEPRTGLGSEKDGEKKPTKGKPLFAGVVGVPRDDQVPKSVTLKPVVIKRFHEDIEFGAKFIAITTSFLEKSQIKPARYKQYDGGLEIIEGALNDLEKIGANGEKYVVSIKD